MATFALELRTEEIPANALPGARAALADGLGSALAEAGYAGLEVRVLSTSRRLIVLVDGLPARQADRSERLTGPPVSVAFAADGRPTKAAEGFARKAGVTVDRLETERTDKGEYLAVTVVRPGRPTAEILAEVVPAVIGAMRFPKMMRWGLGDHLFVRPVHGLVALLDDEVVPIRLFGVASGRTTTGHRVHAPAAVDIPSAGDLVDVLAERGVVVDPAERRRRLDRLAAELAAGAGCRVHPDDELVAEHVELVEHPGLLRGAIDPAFLELPSEVVVTTLRAHQKCLILEREDGALAPFFLAVTDRRDDPADLVRQGNEWVIGARLADARFFFDEDRKRGVEALVPGLERLEFHRVLGSLAAKAGRVGELAAAIADRLGLAVDGSELRRAAHLVKTDLLTSMVVEFPELQGIMGGHYLRLEGADEALWTAARDHYLPSGFDGDIPSSVIGRLLGAADRLDTLAGLFAVGEIPSGSKDPFGLRRAAQALVKIVAESGWALDLGAAAEGAVAGLGELAGSAPADTAAALRDFLAERVRRYLTDRVGVGGDAADAVLAAGWADLPELVARARALDRVRTSPEMRALGLAFKRVKNITEGAAGAAVDPGLFSQPEEGELHGASAEFAGRLAECVADRRFDDAFAAMGELAEVLDRFFVEVLVMTDDERVRANRVALLTGLRRDFMTIADLSRLQIDGGNQ
ncbi:MAG: glycine--tRNA ligase subunit beta [Thermoanaerobaculales bacterium]|jgi:glycyl-tRNA synthetase beta chain|nr:glycine--tRNA ligase subunit beta [Thermoanaerobaculales bacterium]